MIDWKIDTAHSFLMLAKQLMEGSHMLDTNLPGVRLFPTLPHGFDPVSASPKDLLRHGVFLPRPKKIAGLRAMNAWRAQIGHRLADPSEQQRVNEVLAARARLLRPRPDVLHHLSKSVSQNVGVENSPNWNGVAVNGSWVSAQGIFTIPSAFVPDYSPGFTSHNYEAAIWVGLDGQDSASNDVLQAGVTVAVDIHGNVIYTPWYEWFVDNASAAVVAQFQYINQVNFPFNVRAGDVIMVAIAYEQGKNSKTGYVIFNNLSRSSPPWFQPPFYNYPPWVLALSKPTGASGTGASAEWIVESPTVTNNATKVSAQAPLPNFGLVIFTNAVATAQDGQTSDLNQGIVDTMPSSGLSPYYIDMRPFQTQTDILSSTAATIRWTQPSFV